MNHKYIILSLSVLLLVNEASSRKDLKDHSLLSNPNTGQVMVVSEKRGVNWVHVLASLFGFYSLLPEEREEEEKVKEPVPTPRAEENSTEIEYKRPSFLTLKKDNRDLVSTMADYDKSVLIASVTGSGKTTLINSAIRAVTKKEPNVRFLVIDPKSSKWEVPNSTFDDGLPSVLYLKRDNTEEMVSRLKWVADEYLEARQHQRLSLPPGKYNPPRTIIIIDEFMALQTKVKRALSSAAIQEVNDLIAEIIVMGREDKVTVWLVAQTHQCTKIGLSDGVRSNVGVIGLASPDKTDSVEAMAKDHYLFKAKQDRDLISLSINELKGEYFFVSNLKSKVEIEKTPYEKDN